MTKSKKNSPYAKQQAAEEAAKKRWLTVIPAYGRDYRTEAEVLADFAGGKDFQIADVSSRWNGMYTSCRDGASFDVVKVRYGTILDTGFMWPNYVTIEKIDGAWKVTGGTQSDNLAMAEEAVRESSEKLDQVICTCPADCKVHGNIDHGEAKKGRKTRTHTKP